MLLTCVQIIVPSKYPNKSETLRNCFGLLVAGTHDVMRIIPEKHRCFALATGKETLLWVIAVSTQTGMFAYKSTGFHKTDSVGLTRRLRVGNTQFSDVTR